MNTTDLPAPTLTRLQLQAMPHAFVVEMLIDERRLHTSTQARLDQSKAAVDERYARVRQLHDDWTTINEMLNEAADEAGLCEQYEQVIDEINAATIGLKMNKRICTTTVVLRVEFEVEHRTSLDTDDVAEQVRAFVFKHIDNDDHLIDDDLLTAVVNSAETLYE